MEKPIFNIVTEELKSSLQGELYGQKSKII